MSQGAKHKASTYSFPVQPIVSDPLDLYSTNNRPTPQIQSSLSVANSDPYASYVQAISMVSKNSINNMSPIPPPPTIYYNNDANDILNMSYNINIHSLTKKRNGEVLVPYYSTSSTTISNHPDCYIMSDSHNDIATVTTTNSPNSNWYAQSNSKNRHDPMTDLTLTHTSASKSKMNKSTGHKKIGKIAEKEHGILDGDNIHQLYYRQNSNDNNNDINNSNSNDIILLSRSNSQPESQKTLPVLDPILYPNHVSLTSRQNNLKNRTVNLKIKEKTVDTSV